MEALVAAQELRAADIDGDGDLDLVFGKAVGSTGSIVCMLNQSSNGAPADQPFSGVTTLALTPWKHNKAEVTDANNDGKPDLLSIRTTGDWSSGTHPDFPVTLFLNTGSSPADYLNPDASRSLAGFTRIDNCGISAANVMSPLASWDIDNDGDQDLINGSSDWPWTSRPHIYINDGSGNYSQQDSPVYHSSNYYHHGISIFDADLDNDMDAVWTGLHNFADTYPRMWRNDGNLAFSDTTSSWGITARIPGSGNHGMGGYHADLDEDGDLDFVVDMSNGWGSEKIYAVYRNNAVQNGANWLGIHLVASESAPNGIGARVEVTVEGRKLTQLMLDITGGVRNLTSLRFGLGSVASADSVKVYWPSGEVTELTEVQGNQILAVRENADEQPLVPPDTDGDGVNDYREIRDETHPNDPESFNPLSKNLVAHYPFDGDTLDESGYANHAVNRGATVSADRFGGTSGAYDFNGVDAYMDAPPLISDYQRNFTMSGWIRTTHVSSDRLDAAVSALCKTRDAGDFGGPAIDFREGKAVFTFNNNRVFGPLVPFEEWEHVTGDLVADGNWRHYTMSIDANGLITAFINGQQVASHQIATFLEVAGASPFQIGRAGGAHEAGRYFPGQIDDVRIYNRGLTGAEARQIYQSEVANLDSDDDGLLDIHETQTGIFVSATDTGSDPYDSDSSDDGLLDGEVVTAGFNPNTSYTPLFNLVKSKSTGDQARIGLFTESAMIDLNLGGIVLRKSGSTVNLRLQIQSKTDLKAPHWTDEGTETFILDMPGNKAFMRIRALGPQ